MLHLAAVLEVLEVVVLVLEEDPELALLFLDLGHGLQHHLVSIAVRRQWILIMESSNKPIPKIHHFNLLGSVNKVEGNCNLLVNIQSSIFLFLDFGMVKDGNQCMVSKEESATKKSYLILVIFL